MSQELEQATLLVEVLSRLAPHWGELSHARGQDLKRAIYALFQAYCGLDTASGHSLRGAAGGVAGSQDSRDARGDSIASLRCGLVRALRQFVAGEVVG